MKKKIIALILSVLMLLSVAPVSLAASLGDIDGDASISSSDARTALRAAVGLDKLTDEEIKAADVDFDGVITATDARLILRAAVGLENLHTHSYEGTVTKAATCEEKGVKTFTCSCGDSYTEDIPATGHKSVTDKAVAPTCTKEGKTEGTHCSVCNKVLKAQDTVKASGHTAVTDKAVAATCTKEGKTEGSHCSVCNTVIKAQETVPAKGHTSVTDKAVAATCTTAGKTEGSHCSVCNTVIKAQETVPAKGHTSVTDKAVAATCTTAGKTEGSHCSVCNTVLKAQETIPAKGHTSVTDKAVAATCTATGKTEGAHCSVCNATLKPQALVAMVPHTPVTDAAVAPTCTKEGKTEGSHCSVCNKVLTAQTTVAAAAHTPVADPEIPATCTSEGKTAGSHCSVCNAVIIAQDVIPAKGHTSVTDAAVPATCTEPGKTAGAHCSVCGEVLAAQETVPATGHTSVADAAVPATCTEPGKTAGAHCSVCGEVLAAQETVPATGHTSVTDAAVPATCVTPGKTAGAHCSECGEVLTAQETVPATGIHLNSSLDESTVKAVTCKEDGYTGDYKCDVCSAVTEYGEDIETDPEAHGFEKITVPASCEADEYTVMECIHCGAMDTETLEVSGKYPNGTGHTWIGGGAYTTVAPTCEAEGYDTRTCAVEKCGYEERVNFTAAKGHKYLTPSDSKAPTCKENGYEKYDCVNPDCTNVKTVILDTVACNPSVEEVHHGTKTEGDTEGTPCYTEYSCSYCGELVSTVENYGAHRMFVAFDDETGEPKITDVSCTTPAATEMVCDYCDYTEIVETQPALGHIGGEVVKPTCTEPGHISFSGTCTRCNETFTGNENVVLPATGHKLTGVQTCTTSVTCQNPGCEYELEAFGHDYKITSTAIKNANKTVDTFFCTRCGEARSDKLEAFNMLTAKIKTDFFGYDSATNSYPKLHNISKSEAENVPSNINFGIYTSIVKDMFEEEMDSSVSYGKVRAYSVKWELPIQSTNYVSLLENKDIDSITVERLSSLKFSDVLSGFDNEYTVGNSTVNITKYKEKVVNENVIKVTVDVKNEKYYGGIEGLSAAEQTALQKIFGVDVRDQLFSTSQCKKACAADCQVHVDKANCISAADACPVNCTVHHYVKGGDGKLYMETSEDGMTMKMTLNDLTTDGKVTYYFLESTYEPIIAVYEDTETMNQHMDMKISVGITIKGSMDTLSKSKNTTVYVFPNYLPQS